MVQDKPRPSRNKTLLELAQEWDALAPVRADQISSGRDFSFDHVLTPLMLDLAGPALRLAKNSGPVTLLDVGCGTGELTSHIAPLADRVIGIDISKRSLAIARTKLPSATFISGPLESCLADVVKERVNVVVAGMTLMSLPDLSSFADAVRRILPVGGRFIATLTHPWFWPWYWDYAREGWFSYSEEIAIEAPFRISSEQTEFVTTHFHRPLHRYVGEFERQGFDLELLQEPVPSPPVLGEQKPAWKYPRFLGIRWVRRGAG